MAADVSKQPEGAKKFLEKNRVEGAIEAYLAALDAAPQNLEASQVVMQRFVLIDDDETELKAFP
jgi:hypothetical protein